VIYQHPLAYLVGMEGLALMRAWGGDYDETFVRARLAEVRSLLDDEALTGHPGVRIGGGGTREAYLQWAPSYDDPGNQLLQLDLPLIEQILAGLPAGVGVDVACGTGRLAARLAERGHRTTGIDESEAMLARARGRVSGARFVAGDLHRLPLASRSADVLTTGLSLTHVPDLQPVVAEFARVLCPGGSAVISDIHPDLLYRGSIVTWETAAGEPQVAASYRHSVAEYVRAALAAGFRLCRLEELWSGDTGDPEPSSREPATDLGPWRLWPWTLLDRVPEAARASWDTPALLVMHLQLP
jgi:SAM-dependent methyltransferase